MTGFYTNPNIHPEEEYGRRLENLRRYAEASGMPLRVEERYEPDRYLAALGPEPDLRQGYRCRHCYAVRLGAVAAEARRLGAQAFTTTLLISPYQDQEWLLRVGEEAGRAAGVPFLFRDFRPWYRESINRSRELGLYRQNYCGCTYSLEESRARRAAREERRRGEARARAGMDPPVRPML